MHNSFFSIYYKIVSFLLFFTFFTCIFFIPNLPSDISNNSANFSNSITISDKGFAWPIPGFTKITSPFGKRSAPTAGASSFHKGCDIGAPEGTNLIAVTDGQILFTGFLGGGGYTITLLVDNLKISYCHVSPNYIVKKGDTVKRGQIIAHVGPKYVYGVPGNQYADSNGKPTNGATTGCHLHLGIRIDDSYIDPLSFFK